MAIDKDVLDQLLAGRDLQELFAKDGLLDELKKASAPQRLPRRIAGGRHGGAVRTRGHFPGADAAMKLLYLVLNHAADEWKLMLPRFSGHLC
jgi:hypothetical protein